jgi:hypothetical protein
LNFNFISTSIGIIIFPAGGGGTFFGGYLIKKLKLSCSGTMKFCMIVTMFAALLTVCFFLSCPNLHFAGINDSYQLNQSQVLDVEKFERYTDGSVSDFNLENYCNKPCSCSRENYEPVRLNLISNLKFGCWSNQKITHLDLRKRWFDVLQSMLCWLRRRKLSQWNKILQKLQLHFPKSQITSSRKFDFQKFPRHQ